MITAIIPVYHNEEALHKTLKNLCSQDQITEVILIYDGYAHNDSFLDLMFGTYIIKISIFPDIPWALSKARNIGAINATNEYLLFIDVDRVFKERYFFDVKPDKVYKFKIVLDKTVYHPNAMLMHRDIFFKVGGYDERFDGYYGYEDRYLEHVLQINKYEFVNSENELIVLNNGGVKMERNKERNHDLWRRLTGRV